MKRILVDMDGIITDTLPAWLDRIHHHTGVRVHPAEINKWNLSECGQLRYVDPKVILGILNEPGFNMQLQDMPYAVHSLKKLVDDGHDVSIVTARYGDNCMPETIRWIKKTMPWFNTDKKAWFIYDKHRITADILIDDKAETLLQYKKDHPTASLITIDYPYNQHAPSDALRVKKTDDAWNEIYTLIKNMS